MCNNTKIQINIWDELAGRFILNVPNEERKNIVKFCFNIEKAHWYYLDTICLDNKQIKFTINEFAAQLFQHVPFLSRHLYNLNHILEEFKCYKRSIPTYGAILLSKDLKNVLLLQTYWSKGLWGFPKGKLEENEDPLYCAIREVHEETNLDISKLINPEWYIEGHWSNSSMSGHTGLYIILNVPMEFNFATKTNNEIKGCKWFSLDNLFSAKRGVDGRNGFKVTANAFFMAKRLHSFLVKNKYKIERNSNNRS